MITMTKEQFLKALREELQNECEGIMNASDRTEELLHYFGGSALLNFAHFNLQIISLEEMKELDNLLDKAHDTYFEKAKKELENAHKRLF